jgi:hypothetical protein
MPNSSNPLFFTIFWKDLKYTNNYLYILSDKLLFFTHLANMKLFNFVKKILNKDIPFHEKEIRVLEENGFILNDEKTIADAPNEESSNYHSDIKQIRKTVSGYEASAFIEVYSWGTIDAFIYKAGQKKSFEKIKDAINHLKDHRG